MHSREVAGAAPAILALDFDGVLCEGRAEYFEASCRAYAHFWSPSALGRSSRLRERFWRLRPVIMSGWEMPVLVRALVAGVPEARILRDWVEAREATLRSLAVPRDELVARLRTTLDTVRRDWIWAGRDTWLAANRAYAPLDAVRRVTTAAGRTVIVTTKEGEFARLILEDWKFEVADVQGKEAGEHKCENLLALMERYPGRDGGPPGIWFVEDRLETLECVVRHSARDPRLAKVALFLAGWGYTTASARAVARRHPRIRLLTLPQFLRGPAAWPAE